MHRLLRWLLILIGVVLTAVGFLTGLFGMIWTIMFASLWFKGETLSMGDHTGWLACAGTSIGGGLALWGGTRLLRAGGARRQHAGSFRLRTTGPQRRRSVNAAARDTFIWLFLGIECCFIFSHGNATTRIHRTLEAILPLYLGLHALILWHELGHLSCAAFLGCDLQKLQVGTGPIFFQGRFRGLLIEWRAWLGGGLVLAADDQERGWRGRHWLYVAGGPVATALGGALLAWWIMRHRLGPSWLGQTHGVPDIVVSYLLGYSVLFWVFCMIPRKTRVGLVRAHTDGYQLLHTLRFSPEKVRSVIITTTMRRVEMLWEEGRREAAWERLRLILTRYPAEILLLAAEGHYLAEQGDFAGAAASYQQRLQTEGLPEPVRNYLTARCFNALARANEPESARQCCAHALREVTSAQRVALLDALSTEVLSHELHGFLPEADGWSQEALALEPQTITLKGTRGAVLVELGRYEEGEAMLREVWAASASETDAAISAYYLGVMAKHRGSKRQVSLWFGRSRGFAAVVGKWLTQRIDRELDTVKSAPAVEATRV